MTTTSSILARRQLRLAVVSCLENAELAVNGTAVTVQSPGDWAQPAQNLPAVFIQTAMETKTAIMAGIPEFNTVITVLVKATVQNTTAESAQDDVESLWFQIENAILTNSSFVGISQKISNVSSNLEIKSTGSEHLAGIAGSFDVEVFEAYEPSSSSLASITEVGIDVDLKNIYDPTGTYQNQKFPNQVTPSPRTSGPDGRSEGSIDLPLQGG